MRVCFALVVVIAVLATVHAVDNSLADCQAFAANFNNTCTNGVAWASVAAGVAQSVTCPSGMTGTNCPGTVSGSSCTWGRKLCVSCTSVNNVTRIRVQSNNLPPRCIGGPTTNTISNSIVVDFTTNFNPAVSAAAPNFSPITQAQVNAVQCTISGANTGHASVPATSNYVDNGSSSSTSETAIGIGADGTLIAAPMSADSIDPFYPPPGSSQEGVDNCFSHPFMGGVLHYHSMTSCMINPPVGAVSSCAQTPACSSDIKGYMVGQFSAYQTQRVIGLMKDGHPLYGPYASAGVKQTGMDVCTGKFDSNNNYAYWAVNTYPYTAGCYGPGNYPCYHATCTSNPSAAYNATCASGANVFAQPSWVVAALALIVAVAALF